MIGRKPRSIGFLLWTGVLLVLPVPLLAEPEKPTGEPSASVHPVKEDLQGIGRHVEQEQEMIHNLERTSTSLLQTVSKIDQELQSASVRQSETEQMLRQADLELTNNMQKREQAARTQETVRLRLRKRLRDLYKLGELGWMNVLFGGNSLGDVIQRYRLLQSLAGMDRSLIAQMNRSREQLNSYDLKLRQDKERWQEVRNRADQQRQLAAAARDEKIKTLQLIEQQEALHRKALQELTLSRQRLLQVVATLEGQGSASQGFRSWQGRLPSPCEKGTIEAPFGRRVDPRFKTVTINQGVDIRAERGSKIKAIYPGTVAFADAFQGYGLLLILDHGGGYYSLYAHLDRFLVAKEDKVTQGQPIGLMGETGSLKGVYLYFEIREVGKAVDPQQWVKF